MEQNQYAHNIVHNYLMQPGDATMYRFAFQNFPPINAYTVSDGVGTFGQGFIWFCINMPGGTGVSVLDKSHLRSYRENPHYDIVTDWLKTNGMAAVHDYTLKAVLLALSVLVNDPTDVENASAAMLEARQHA